MKSRPYVMRARAEATEQRKGQIVGAAMQMFLSMPFDTVTLQALAKRAEVSLKTVTRMFGSKEGLIRACIEAGPRIEEGQRVVDPGDVAGAAAVLAARYEAMLPQVLHMVALTERLPIVREWIDRSRRSHRDWLAGVFAPWLPARGRDRQIRLLQLFGATELYVWWSWRVPLAASVEEATLAMQRTLHALTAGWEAK